VRIAKPRDARHKTPARKPKSGQALTTLWNLSANVALPYENAIAVAIAWAVLWRSGNWRPEPTWIDRLGRALGVIWIGSALLFKVVHIF
jgi:hypothetical protein